MWVGCDPGAFGLVEELEEGWGVGGACFGEAVGFGLVVGGCGDGRGGGRGVLDVLEELVGEWVGLVFVKMVGMVSVEIVDGCLAHTVVEFDIDARK